MKTYSPINLVNTNLNPSELHYHSYTISPFRKFLNSYSRSLDYYTVHLTNERLIIETYINHDIIINFYKIYRYLPLPENLLSIVNHSRINIAKRSMDLIKYKSISLPYTIIASLDKVHLNGVYVIRIILKLLDNDLEIKAFRNLDFDTFKVYPVQKIDSLKDISQSLQSLFTDNIDEATLDFSSSVSFFLNLTNLFPKP